MLLFNKEKELLTGHMEGGGVWVKWGKKIKHDVIIIKLYNIWEISNK